MAQAWEPGWRRIVMNPDGSGDGYKLHANGTIVELGSAPPSGWAASNDWARPGWAYGGPAAGLTITDWTTPGGYVLDYYGAVHEFGSATAGGGVPEYAIGFPQFVDFAMDPNGNGKGWLLDLNGNIRELAGTTNINSGLSLFFQARRLVAENPVGGGGKMYVLDAFGGIHPLGGAPTITSKPGWPGNPVAVAIVIDDWTTGQGWVLASLGSVHPLNYADAAPGGPYWTTQVARDLANIDDDPRTFRLLDNQGAVHGWVISSAPTVNPGVLGPADPTTTTTRPVLTYGYSDVDGNSMKSARVVLYRADRIGDFQDEVQVLTRTGSPSAGSFRIHLEGAVTGTIPYNATGATIAFSMAADLPGMQGVGVTGSAGGPWTVTFGTGDRSGCLQRPLRITANTMNGGGAVTVTQTAGTDVFHPLRVLGLARADWMITDGTQGLLPDFDLEGGPDDGGDVEWVMYAEVTDSSNTRSGQRRYQWTQSVNRPDTPVVVLDDRGGTSGIAVGVTIPSVDPDSLLDVQFSDDYNPFDPNAATWDHVANTVMIPGGTTTVGGLQRKGDLLGFNAWPLNDGGGVSGNNISKIEHIGAKHFRFTEEWQWIETSEGTYDWTAFDAHYAYGAANGRTVCTSLLGVPSWVNPHSMQSYTTGDGAAAGHPIEASGHWLPTNQAGRDKAAAFAVLLASKLRPGIDLFEIWNEPNIEAFNRGLYQVPGATSIAFPGRGPWYQSPELWALLVRDVTAAVRAFFPTLKIVAGSFGAVGDLNAPQSAGNRIDLAPHNYLLSAHATVPAITTTHRPDYWGIHPYTFGGGENNYPGSLPNNTSGWNGHIQGDRLRDVLTYIGVPSPKLMVTETGAPGAASSGAYGVSAAVVADGYTETFQAYYAATDAVECFNRVLLGLYTPPVYLHTLSEDTTQGTGSFDRYMSLYREGPSAGSPASAIKPAGQVWKDVAAEYLSGTVIDGHPAQIVDLEAPFGKARYYRARVYQPDPWISSPWTEVQAATLSGPMWVLSIPDNPWAQLDAEIVPPLDTSRGVVGYVAQPAGASLPVAIRDGAVKGVSGSIQVWTLTDAQTKLMRLLLAHKGPLLLRNPFGDAWYLTLSTDSVLDELIQAPNPATEPQQFLTRNAHRWTLPVTQIARTAVSTADPGAAFFAAG